MACTGEFNFNIKAAVCGVSPQYADAYYTSNEPLHWQMTLTPPAGKRVLTVAASGDQPLLYAANGATHIDTFDITYNARVLMDFKTTALRTLNMAEYKNTISYIYDLWRVTSDEKFNAVVDNMPPDTQPVMRAYIKHAPNAFCREVVPHLTTPRDQNEYDIMRQNAPREFNFIWANLVNLHKYLTGKYDIINLSNIFDHFSINESEIEIIDTIKTLLPYLDENGCVLSSTFGFFNHCEHILPILAAQAGLNMETHKNPTSYFRTSVITRIR